MIILFYLECWVPGIFHSTSDFCLGRTDTCISGVEDRAFTCYHEPGGYLGDVQVTRCLLLYRRPAFWRATPPGSFTIPAWNRAQHTCSSPPRGTVGWVVTGRNITCHCLPFQVPFLEQFPLPGNYIYGICVSLFACLPPPYRRFLFPAAWDTCNLLRSLPFLLLFRFIHRFSLQCRVLPEQVPALCLPAWRCAPSLGGGSPAGPAHCTSWRCLPFCSVLFQIPLVTCTWNLGHTFLTCTGWILPGRFWVSIDFRYWVTYHLLSAFLWTYGIVH